jgi:hypothetical protein
MVDDFKINRTGFSLQPSWVQTHAQPPVPLHPRPAVMAGSPFKTVERGDGKQPMTMTMTMAMAAHMPVPPAVTTAVTTAGGTSAVPSTAVSDPDGTVPVGSSSFGGPVQVRRAC